jgi:hypothetical protein
MPRVDIDVIVPGSVLGRSRDETTADFILLVSSKVDPQVSNGSPGCDRTKANRVLIESVLDDVYRSR